MSDINADLIQLRTEVGAYTDKVQAARIKLENLKHRMKARSETMPTAKLFASLIKAQLEFPVISKDSTNPHFKNKYVSLDNAVDVLQPVLNKHGLAVIQTFEDLGNGKAGIRTILAHESGETIEGTQPLSPVKDDPQGIASASTYARRYGLLGICGVAPSDEDDDGNLASGRGPAKPAQQKSIKEEAPVEALSKMRAQTLAYYVTNKPAMDDDVGAQIDRIDQLDADGLRSLYKIMAAKVKMKTNEEK